MVLTITSYQLPYDNIFPTCSKSCRFKRLYTQIFINILANYKIKFFDILVNS